MKLIKRILTFNADFRFLKNNQFPRIIEINSDNMSRYSVAQSAGYYPRKIRYQNLVNRASKNDISLAVLYNPSFLKNLEKAKRWGVDSYELLAQKNFFPANLEGIDKLENYLKTTHSQHWVLLLSVYRVPHFYSALSADPRIKDTLIQQRLTRLLDNKNDNTTFIGDDIQLERISNDKFLTSKFLPSVYQPKSILMINGIEPHEATRNIISALENDDVILKPLSSHSGIGILRAKNKNALFNIFSAMHTASAKAEINSLGMNLNLNDPNIFWIGTKGNNSFVHCQSYAPTETISNEEITYRIVATAFIDKDNNVEIETESIYPKKSDVNDFKSKIYNEIDKSAITVTMYDEYIKKSIIPGIESFVKCLTKEYERTVANHLLAGSDAEFLKGLDLYLDSDLAKELNINHHVVNRKIEVERKLMINNPQSFINLYSNFNKINMYLNNLQPQKTMLHTFSFYEIIIPYLSLLTKEQRISFIKSKKFDNSSLGLALRFIYDCKKINEFICDGTSFLFNIIYSKELYNKINKLKSFAEILAKSNDNLKLMVVINLFELRKNISSLYPEIAQEIKIGVEKTDDLIDFFQSDNVGNIIKFEPIKIVYILKSFANLSFSTVGGFPKTINGLLLSDQIKEISNALIPYYFGNIDTHDPYAKLLFLYVNWYNNSINFTSEQLYSTDWQVRCQGTKLIDIGIEMIANQGIVSKEPFLRFVFSYLSEPGDKFSFYKSIEFITEILKLKDDHKIDNAFRSELSTIIKKNVIQLKLLDRYTEKFEARVNAVCNALAPINKLNSPEKSLSTSIS